MTGIVKLYDSLVSDYDRAQTELNEVDRNLRKLAGSREAGADSRGRASLLVDRNNRKRRISDVSSSRRNGNVKDEDEKILKKPTLLSTIANVPVPLKVEQLKEEESIRKPEDRKGLARNRRMFGMILGTLQKFQSEESTRKEVMTKREKIEMKVEQAAEKEKKVMKKEKEELRRNMRQKKTELRKIELKIERVKIHQEWEKSLQSIGNFIQTKTKPCIFYCPAKQTPETEKKLKDTKDKFRIILAERRVKVQKELAEIDELYKKDLGDNDEDVADDLGVSDMRSHVKVEPKDETKEGKAIVSEGDETSLNLSPDLMETNELDSPTTNLNQNPLSKIKEDSLIDSKLIKNGKDDTHEDETLEEKEFEPIYDE